MSGHDEANLGPDDPLQPIAQHPAVRRRLLFAALLVGLLTLLLVVQGIDATSPTRRFLAHLLVEVRDPRWGAVYVLVAFAAGTVLFAPITVMFVAVSLALSPIHGFAYCLLGGAFGASLAYGVGRGLGARPLARLRGARLERLEREVRLRPLRSVLIARFLPIGNFTLINLILGSLRVPYTKFVLGTVIGMVPGVLGITLCKGLLERVLSAPSAENIALLLGGLSAVILTLYLVARVIARRRRAQLRAAREAAPTPP